MNNLRLKLTKTKAFTLIELLVVFSIIAILLSISLVAFNSTRKSARDGKRKSDLELLRAALEMYRTDIGSYPTDQTLGVLVTSKYTAAIPTDPLPGYLYSYVPGTNSYTLCASLEIVSGVAVSGCGSCGTGVCYYKVTNP